MIRSSLGVIGPFLSDFVSNLLLSVSVFVLALVLVLLLTSDGTWLAGRPLGIQGDVRGSPG